METRIKEWIRIAQKIGHHLLNPGQKADRQVTDWIDQSPRSAEILNDLSRSGYYIQQAASRKRMDDKYNWDEFVRSQKQKQHRRMIRIAGYAASMALLIATGYYILSSNNEEPATWATIQTEIQPGSMKAVLVLGDGQEMQLDSQQTFTEKDGTVILNGQAGELTYLNTHQEDTVLQYNTLRIPRGGEYRLTLADGTKVWVNSESELKYPTRFKTGSREVFLKGEAYFEIAHNKSQPFYINIGSLKVHATGTAFNVAAYADDADWQVTLTEGGVNIEEGPRILSRLLPNDQFVLNKKEGNFQVKQVDPRVATAWKNGTFFFEDTPLSSIIQKLSRWYDVDISCCKAELNQYKFSGEIRKYEEISNVLDMLKLTNEITYSIKNNRHIVLYPIE